jgi:preprotein translocase subunit SecG
MLFGLVLVIHILVAFFLVAVILLQGGRGGLGEALGGAAAQSLFGGGANVVMARVTAGAAAMFMVTCLSLAALSTAQGQSVIDRMPAAPQELPAAFPGAALPETPAPAPADPSDEPAPAGEPSGSSPTHDTTSP